MLWDSYRLTSYLYTIITLLIEVCNIVYLFLTTMNEFSISVLMCLSLFYWSYRTRSAKMYRDVKCSDKHTFITDKTKNFSQFFIFLFQPSSFLTYIKFHDVKSQTLLLLCLDCSDIVDNFECP